MEEDIKNMSKEELLEYLEDISQQLDNIALDQIQFAISELQFFKEEYKKLEEKNKRKNIEPVIINNKMHFIDKELYIDLLKDIKTYYIPTSVIQNKLSEIDEKIKNYKSLQELHELQAQKFILELILEKGNK